MQTTKGDSITCPTCQIPTDKDRIGQNVVAKALQAQKQAESSTPCDNCSGDSAVFFCFDCAGFFCSNCDDRIHKIGIFRTHHRDSDRRNFVNYVSQRKKNPSFGRTPVRTPLMRSGIQTPRVAATPKNVVAAAHNDASNPALLNSALSSLGGPSCNIHGLPLDLFCPVHNRSLCLSCKSDMDGGKAILPSSGDDTASKAALQKEPCLAAKCRSIFTRIELLQSINKVRLQLQSQIVKLQDMLGSRPDHPTKSIFSTLQDKINQKKVALQFEVDTAFGSLQQLVEKRVRLLTSATEELKDRDMEILQMQSDKLGTAGEFINVLTRIGKYLCDKETAEVLTVEELETIFDALNTYTVIRINETPYTKGTFSLKVDPNQALESLRGLVNVHDAHEDDGFESGRVVSSLVSNNDLHQIQRIVEAGTTDQVRSIGGGDFPYFLALRILESEKHSLRIGFVDRHAPDSEDIGLGDATSNAFSFSCSENGDLVLRVPDGRIIQVSMHAPSGVPPKSPSSWGAGRLIGVLLDRRRGLVQLYIDGEPSEEISFKKCKIPMDFEYLVPAIDTDGFRNSFSVEFARFVPDADSIPAM